MLRIGEQLRLRSALGRSLLVAQADLLKSAAIAFLSPAP
jgi:hypothetical protein